MSYFKYNASSNLPTTAFRIAPSQLSSFFDNTSQWYRENLLGEVPAFTGSTASELGTIVHAAAHMYHDTRKVDRAAIEAYINTLPPDIDRTVIREQYPIMVETLINSFLSTNLGTHAEHFIPKEILPNIYVAGTIDSYCQNRKRIRDFKTMGSLDTARLPTSFPRAYWFQQMSYAYAMIKNGFEVDYLDLVYITRNNTGRYNDKGKALKDYPSQVHIITEPVTNDTLSIIEGVLKLVAHSVQHWNTHSEHRYLLAQDFRLYPKPKPSLFRD